MLTRLKLKQGEGELEKFNPEIGKRRTFPQSEMTSEQNLPKFDAKAFERYFLEMKALVEILLQERHE